MVRFPIDGRGSGNNLLLVSSRLTRWVTVVTLTLAVGGHLAILQSVAWVTMVAGYAQTEPLKEALIKTFDGKHPCPICKLVSKEKKSEQKQETPKLLTKLDFLLASSRVSIYPPVPDTLQSAPLRAAETRAEAPPVPPPRSLSV
jgi:hypothetical protein